MKVDISKEIQDVLKDVENVILKTSILDRKTFTRDVATRTSKMYKISKNLSLIASSGTLKQVWHDKTNIFPHLEEVTPEDLKKLEAFVEKYEEKAEEVKKIEKYLALLKTRVRVE